MRYPRAASRTSALGPLAIAADDLSTSVRLSKGRLERLLAKSALGDALARLALGDLHGDGHALERTLMPTCAAWELEDVEVSFGLEDQTSAEPTRVEQHTVFRPSGCYTSPWAFHLR
ncbi:MAG: hypothetical protein H0U82_11225 [Actinobacteria bacterium]|nr:hypothetical protein [Actinomycetota bacterium]